jgi:hypothetical protein
MSVLIDELSHTPEKVQRGDFVLNVASGLAPAVSRLTLLCALPAMIGRYWSGCCVIVLARPRTTCLGG